MNDDPRVWIPEEYLDEITPPGRAHPNDWIKERNGAKGVTLHPADALNDDGGVKFAAGTVVQFFWTIELARVPATIDRDGGVLIRLNNAGKVPASYDRVCTTYGDGGHSSSNVQGIGAEYASAWGDDWTSDVDGKLPSTVDVELIFLREGDEAFRLVVGDAGALIFIEERAVN